MVTTKLCFRVSLLTIGLMAAVAVDRSRGDETDIRRAHEVNSIANANLSAPAAATKFMVNDNPSGGLTGKAGELHAARILKDVSTVYSRMKTLTADYTVRQDSGGGSSLEMHGSLRASKPNLYAIDGSGSLPLKMVSDGHTVLIYIKQQNAYARIPADEHSMNLTVTSIAPLTLFFNSHKLTAPNTPTLYLGVERLNGMTYDCVEQHIGPNTMRYYIGADRIVYRMKIHAEAAGHKQDVDATLSNVLQNIAFSASDFNTVAPSSAQRFEMPLPGVQSLEVGDQAPQFVLPQPQGPSVTLSEILHGKKAVLITFWFCACATCREEHPLLQKLFGSLKDRGLGVVAVDSFDNRSTVQSYLKASGLTFTACLDDDGKDHHGVAKQYGIVEYPTTFLVGPNGKIVYRGVGFNEAETRAALAKLDVR